MGPGSRVKFQVVPGWQLGVYFLRWPYLYTIGINLFKFRIEIGLGLAYTDPGFPRDDPVYGS